MLEVRGWIAGVMVVYKILRKSDGVYIGWLDTTAKGQKYRNV
jgi:hypothetical protein